MELENELSNNKEKQNELNNNKEIQNEQKNFINNTMSSIINTSIDIGLRAILPDLIENQIIEIKNALLENGLKSGIDTAVNSAINFGKSIQGIFTGNFENIEQINNAISKGGIIDSMSNIIDFATDKAYNLNIINKTVTTLIKQGKNLILDNISNNIKKELNNQSNYIENLKDYVDSWKEHYNNKDFDGMEKAYDKIKKQIEKIVPIENLIKETREIETLHNFIKNNNQNFNISEQEMETIKYLN